MPVEHQGGGLEQVGSSWYGRAMTEEPQERQERKKARPPMTDRQLAGWCLSLGLVFGLLEGQMLRWNGTNHIGIGVIAGCLVGIAAFFVIRNHSGRRKA
jgi:hypothetical protein